MKTKSEPVRQHKSRFALLLLGLLVSMSNIELTAHAQNTSSAPNKAQSQHVQSNKRVRALVAQTAKAYTEKNYGEVIRTASEGLKLEPKQAALLAYRAASYLELRMRDEALADYTTLIEVSPNASAYYKRSTIYDFRDEARKALSDLEESVKLLPSARLELKIAYTHKDLNEPDAAIAACKKALTMLKHEDADIRIYIEAECYEVITICYLRKNSPKQALESINKAIAISDKWPEKNAWNVKVRRANIIFHRGEAYEKLGNLKNAIADYETAKKAVPKNFGFRRSLLKAYRNTNLNEKALALVTEMLREDDSPDLYYKRAEIYEKLGKVELAKVDRARAKKTESTFMGN